MYKLIGTINNDKEINKDDFNYYNHRLEKASKYINKTLDLFDNIHMEDNIIKVDCNLEKINEFGVYRSKVNRIIKAQEFIDKALCFFDKVEIKCIDT